MSNKRVAKYNFSGEEKDIKNLLRLFQTDELLKRINKETVDILNHSKEDGLFAAKRIMLPLQMMNSNIVHKQDSIITIWGLIDLAYYSIKYSNDYRGKNIEDDSELYLLAKAVDGYIEKRMQGIVDNVEENPTEFMLYFWGFAGEQLKAERLGKVLSNAGRELYMLFESSKGINFPEEISISEIVLAETGYSWEQILSALTFAWFYFKENDIWLDDCTLIKDNDFLRNIDIKSILQRYAGDYKEIRESKNGRQFFYTKPYVMSQKGEILSINTYLNVFIYEHCILWIVREYYRKREDTRFISYFGKCFEEYFKELLETYLKSNEYEKIPEKKIKSADWKIEVCGYKFLVEQKSSLMMLSIKQQETDVEALKKYSLNTIIKAVKQLDITEETYGDGKYIKIILLYDDYLKPEVLDQIFLLDDCCVENDSFYWLATIRELEMLFSLCENQRELFIKVIEEKIEREIGHSKEGKSIEQILGEYGINKNKYVKQEKIQFYTDLAINKLKEVLE